MERATAITSSNRRCCALLTKTNSNVPTYADELVFVKSNLIFRRLPACRQACLHAERPLRRSLMLYAKNQPRSEKYFIVLTICDV